MIELDLTQHVGSIDAAYVDFPDGALVLLNGFCPDGGVESVHQIDGALRTEVETQAGAHVRGTGISNYIVRERVLPVGTYEIVGQPRRGSVQRTFVVSVSKEGDRVSLKVRSGDAPSTWIVGVQDPVCLKAGECLTVHVENGVETIELG